MKRALSIIALLVAMVFVFTGCSNTPTPTIADRWADGETVTFNISLADETNVKDFAEEVPVYNEVAGAQVKPSKVDGTLTYNVNKVDGKWVLTTAMVVAETYPASKLPTDWKTTLDSAEIIYTQNGSDVIITSMMGSESVFGTVYNQTSPVSSKKGVFGVMVYYNEQKAPALTINNFETETTYADGKATTKFDDKTGTVTNREKETTVDLDDEFVFDNESLLLAIRSIDMAMLAEANTMSLNFFNSVNQKVEGVTVAISSDEYQLEGEDKLTYRIGVSLDTVSSYSYFMYFEQTEKIAHPGGGVGAPIMQQQLVEMNSGYMHFERV